MKLVLAIVQDEDAENLVRALVEKEYGATRIPTAGGFLRRGNATIIIGVNDEQVPDVLDLIAKNCHTRTEQVSPMTSLAVMDGYYLTEPIEVEVGGAVVFVLAVEKYVRI